MPFRDAGRGPSDFNLNIQDCLWGIWKAMQNGLCNMNEFDIEDYEYFEKVENGDWNWLTPNFIAFASPVDTNWIKQQKEPCPLSSSVSSNLALQRKLPTPFLSCLDYFEKRNIKLVVRLNTELYDRKTFLDRGIDHMELYFDDGTNPTDEIVRTFINIVDRIVESGGVVAVHVRHFLSRLADSHSIQCKAGLGRTGTLIGAYLIWKYGFTANEAIAFMRIVRPGSVVGPQQQYMYLKQLEWTKWAAVDELKGQEPRAKSQAAPAVATPITVDGLPVQPITADDESSAMRLTPPPSIVALPPVTPSRHIATAAAKANDIAPPGQPRKTPLAKRLAQDSDDEDELADILPELGVAPPTRQIKAVPTSRGGAPSSAPANTRVTRSSVAKTTGTVIQVPESPIKASRPNKIPRLATTRTTAASRALALANESEPTTMRTRSQRSVIAPPPSRLPTLVHKRAQSSSLSDVANIKNNSKESDSWVANNTAGVIAPGSKSQRPGLRSVRRRRSSFSSADVVA